MDTETKIDHIHFGFPLFRSSHLYDIQKSLKMTEPEPNYMKRDKSHHKKSYNAYDKNLVVQFRGQPWAFGSITLKHGDRVVEWTLQVVPQFEQEKYRWYQFKPCFIGDFKISTDFINRLMKTVGDRTRYATYIPVCPNCENCEHEGCQKRKMHFSQKTLDTLKAGILQSLEEADLYATEQHQDIDSKLEADTEIPVDGDTSIPVPVSDYNVDTPSLNESGISIENPVQMPMPFPVHNPMIGRFPYPNMFPYMIHQQSPVNNITLLQTNLHGVVSELSKQFLTNRDQKSSNLIINSQKLLIQTIELLEGLKK